MVTVDPRPETQVKSVAHAIRAQPVSRPGVRKPPLRGRWTGAVHERREDVSRFPRPGSRCFASSFNTRQSCRGPTSVERAGHSVPTVRASRSPVRTVAGRAATVAMTAARCCWQVHKPFRIASRPRTWHQKWFVCKIRLPTSRHNWQQRVQKGSVPQWFAPTTVYRRVRRRKVESDTKISCAKLWRSSFSGSLRGSPTFRTPSPQATQPRSAGWQV